MIIDKGKFQAEQFSHWKDQLLSELEELKKRVEKLEKQVEKLEKSAKKPAKEKAE